VGRVFGGSPLLHPRILLVVLRSAIVTSELQATLQLRDGVAMFY
jgi:hypothetical protein